MGRGGLGWLRVWASLGSLSKYGRFFCLHLSHAGHGPRDLLSRYCRQDCASSAWPAPPPPTPPPACSSSQHPAHLRARAFRTSREPSTKRKVLGPMAGGHTHSLCLPVTSSHSPKGPYIQLSHYLISTEQLLYASSWGYDLGQDGGP